MLTELIESRITAQERRLGEDLDYLKYILRTSRPAFFNYVKVVPMANFRQTLPSAPYHAVALLAAIHEGCGNCTQIEINKAKASRVSTETIRAIIKQQPEKLSDEILDCYLFARAILDDAPEQEQLRLRIVERFGDAGLVELCMKIAGSRVFPLMTRALGFASSCTEVQVSS